MQKNKVITRICPECYNKNIKEDFIRNELYCQNCGLVIQAPAICGINMPGYAIKIQTFIQLINTPVLLGEVILTPEQLEKIQLRELSVRYPPVSEESKL